MVFAKESTSSEIAQVLDTKVLVASPMGYTLPTGMYENSDVSLMLESLLPDDI